jgi:hypothetical protein
MFPNLKFLHLNYLYGVWVAHERKLVVNIPEINLERLYISVSSHSPINGKLKALLLEIDIYWEEKTTPIVDRLGDCQSKTHSRF